MDMNHDHIKTPHLGTTPSIAATPGFWLAALKLDPDSRTMLEPVLQQIIEAVDQHTTRCTQDLRNLAAAQAAELEGLRRRQAQYLVASSEGDDDLADLQPAPTNQDKPRPLSVRQVDELLHAAADCAELAGELDGLIPSVRMINVVAAIRVRVTEMLDLVKERLPAERSASEVLQLKLLTGVGGLPSFQYRVGVQVASLGEPAGNEPLKRAEAISNACHQLTGFIEGAGSPVELSLHGGRYIGDLLLELAKTSNALYVNLAQQGDIALSRQASPDPGGQPGASNPAGDQLPF